MCLDTCLYGLRRLLPQSCLCCCPLLCTGPAVGKGELFVCMDLVRCSATSLCISALQMSFLFSGSQAKAHCAFRWITCDFDTYFARTRQRFCEREWEREFLSPTCAPFWPLLRFLLAASSSASTYSIINQSNSHFLPRTPTYHYRASSRATREGTQQEEGPLSPSSTASTSSSSSTSPHTPHLKRWRGKRTPSTCRSSC